MLTRWLLLAACGCLALTVQRSAAAQQVNWLRSAQQAADEAQRTGKPILVYVKSANCHYCDLMQRNVWENSAAANAVRRNFVPLKLTREENEEAIRVLQIKGYPSTLVFSPTRKFVHRVDGYLAPEKFLVEMEKAQVASAASRKVITR